MQKVKIFIKKVTAISALAILFLNVSYAENNSYEAHIVTISEDEEEFIEKETDAFMEETLLLLPAKCTIKLANC